MTASAWLLLWACCVISSGLGAWLEAPVMRRLAWLQQHHLLPKTWELAGQRWTRYAAGALAASVVFVVVRALLFDAALVLVMKGA